MRPDEAVEEMGYFVWGLNALMREPAILIDEEIYPSRLAELARSAFDEETDPSRKGVHLRYLDLVGEYPRYPNFSLTTPADWQYRADNELLQEPENDYVASYLMRISFLAALSGISDALAVITLLMLRAPIDRQVTLAHFLRLITADQVGNPRLYHPRVIRFWNGLGLSRSKIIFTGQPRNSATSSTTTGAR